MKYLCLVYIEQSTLDALSRSERDALMDEGNAWMEEIEKGGHHVLSAGLQSVRLATTVRHRNGRMLITDGPFAETKEQLGGFTMIEARDLNEAIRLASELAAVTPGSIEVRPVEDVIAGDHVLSAPGLHDERAESTVAGSFGSASDGQ
jgi:hypothetical protein